MHDAAHGCANCTNGGSCARKANRKETSVLSLVRSSPQVPMTPYTPHTPALPPLRGPAYAAEQQLSTKEGEARLREISIALVRRLKSDGLPPERVIVAIKT